MSAIEALYLLSLANQAELTWAPRVDAHNEMSA